MLNYGTHYIRIIWNWLFDVWFSTFLNFWLCWVISFCCFTAFIFLWDVATDSSWVEKSWWPYGIYFLSGLRSLSFADETLHPRCTTGRRLAAPTAFIHHQNWHYLSFFYRIMCINNKVPPRSILCYSCSFLELNCRCCFYYTVKHKFLLYFYHWNKSLLSFILMTVNPSGL